ncbi:asb029 [Agrotis segetum nucleopolyhedrovirus B]|uniref:Asb029 n=1 Tax=Agrotis segetum nucleopolyhedrovirus B TaxID=1580580 RepID=A0A0A7KRB9_9ABAC|nr:asb029 [Agrotis segetum nucleopolyhedrovirus B]AIZ48587.1 asb029 [Agrotis segetum nucleopolyhedrovirus B]
MSTIRNKRLVRTIEQIEAQNKFRQVPICDLKKVSRAISILQQSNARMGRIVKCMHNYYEQKYKIKVSELETALQRKCQKIAQLQDDNTPPAYLFIVRNKNCVQFFEEFAQLNEALRDNNQWRVVLCRISKSTAVERALVITVARSKSNDTVVLTKNSIQFQSNDEAEAFEEDIRLMFE